MPSKDLLPDLTYFKDLTDFAVNNSIDGIRAMDLNYNYILFSPGLEKITGYKKDDVLGRNAYEVFPFLKKIGEDKIIERALKGETVIVTDRDFIIPERGRVGTFTAVHAPLYDEFKNIVGCYAIIRDVSEIKRKSKALDETEQKLENLTQVINDALITINSKGSILSWNRGAVEIFGYTELEAKDAGISAILPEFNWQQEIRPVQLVNNYTRNNLLTAYRKNLSTVPVEISLSRWNSGHDHFLSLGIRDLSDYSHLENQAYEYKELYEGIIQIHNDLNQGIVTLDPNSGRPVFINQAYADMLGYTIDELMSFENHQDLLFERDEVLILKLTNLLNEYQEKVSHFYKVKLRHKDGSPIFIEAAIKHFDTSSGRILFAIVRQVGG